MNIHVQVLKTIWWLLKHTPDIPTGISFDTLHLLKHKYYTDCMDHFYHSIGPKLPKTIGVCDRTISLSHCSRGNAMQSQFPHHSLIVTEPSHAQRKIGL